MSRTKEELEGVTLLGSKKTDYKYEYDASILETFLNKHPENDYVVTFDAYEYTSLCPVTGQPDFAKIVLSYIPRERMVESKSFKLYLFAQRSAAHFHEDCVNIIAKDLINLMDPKYLEVRGIFSPRGGISIFPFVNYTAPDCEYLKPLAEQRKIDVLRDGANRTVRYDM